MGASRRSERGQKLNDGTLILGDDTGAESGGRMRKLMLNATFCCSKKFVRFTGTKEIMKNSGQGIWDPFSSWIIVIENLTLEGGSGGLKVKLWDKIFVSFDLS